jgi:hypothetical protein
MKIFYTYLHCKPNGDPFYVGKGSGKRGYDLKNRRNQQYKNVIEKYLKENIGIFIFPCLDEQQAHIDEIKQIAQLRSEGYELCNITNGGEGTSGVKRSLETRRKMSASKIGNKNGIGNKSRRGMKASAVAIAKMSASRKGRPAWSKGKKGILSKLYGRKQSPETCAKKSLSLMGNKNALKNRLSTTATSD